MSRRIPAAVAATLVLVALHQGVGMGRASWLPASGQQERPLPRASSVPAVPPLGFGRPASDRGIADLDLDVLPDGTGLPPGSGNAEEGGALYAARCATCHGPDGLGTPAGWPLVGRNPGDAFDFNENLDKELRRTIGNFWPYAPTIFDYIRRSMPADRPGSLTDDEVYAITAWLLWRNGLITRNQVMDAATLPQVEMPARDRFIPDDRWARD